MENCLFTFESKVTLDTLVNIVASFGFGVAGFLLASKYTERKERKNESALGALIVGLLIEEVRTGLAAMQNAGNGNLPKASVTGK